MTKRTPPWRKLSSSWIAGRNSSPPAAGGECLVAALVTFLRSVTRTGVGPLGGAALTPALTLGGERGVWPIRTRQFVH